MIDRTAAALASALPAGMGLEVKPGVYWSNDIVAAFQAERLAESGWRLVHDDDRPTWRPAMSEFKPGDRVYVTDSALARMRQIMREATGVEPAPNHHGTVDQVARGFVYINFDNEDGPGQGSCAPYPPAEVRHLLGGDHQ
jgi:hypothetical protein